MNAIASISGFRWYERYRRMIELRFKWGEITLGRIGFAINLHNWSEDGRWSLQLHLLWANAFFKLPLAPREPREQMMDSWGLSLVGGDSIHLHWGEHCKIVHLPWDWKHYATLQLMKDRSWRNAKEIESLSLDSFCLASNSPNAWRTKYSYVYRLNSGEVQERWAEVTVDRMEWRWKWFGHFLPWPRLRRQSINVNFNDEVGERTGSWKGGCLGCGYTMQPYETPESCLRRMEFERKFT